MKHIGNIGFVAGLVGYAGIGGYFDGTGNIVLPVILLLIAVSCIGIERLAR